MNKSVIFVLLSIIFSFINLNALTTPQLADSAYNKEDYLLATELYEQTLAEFGPNADVYYNLGNTWYRRGNIAQTILAYERALRIDPSNSDILNNLKFVRTQLQDKPEDNNSLLTRVHNNIVYKYSANSWAWTAFIVFIVLLIFIAAYLISSNIRIRKLGFFGGIVLLVLVIYLIVVAHDASVRLNTHNEAIVTVPTTLLNSVPRQPKQTEKVVPLHEGTKVEIVDSVATPDDPVSPQWYKIRINGSNAAWLRATDVTRI